MNKEKILKLGNNSITSEDYDLIYETAKGSDVAVEIGARLGCSSMLLGSIAGKLYSIECDPLPQWYENIKEMGLTNVTLIQTYSPWLDIIEDIDYLLIDGDHRTMFCIADYVRLMPWVKVGGKIAFHDTLTKDENCGFMVSRAIDIILEESKNLKEIGRCAGINGTVVFEKLKEFGT
jgi:predicted O-methyltransferase YrrM